MKSRNDLHELRTKVDDEVYERIRFMRLELCRRDKRNVTTNDVLRQLMVEAGWIPARKWPHNA